jgi:FkbH-like protein
MSAQIRDPNPRQSSNPTLVPREASVSSLAVSATFTAESLQDSLVFWMRELGIEYPIRFASYNQVFQELLDPSSLLATNRNGVNVVLVRFEDWSRFNGGSFQDSEPNVRHLISCLRTAAQSFQSPLLVCICPASPAFLADPQNAREHARMEALLESELRGLGTVHLVTTEELKRLYPVPDYYDRHGDELGHLPYTPTAYAALGTMIARKVRAMRTAPYKVIALDCDETLWQGICGEDGPQGVSIDVPRRALQEFMLAQHRAGMLLCLCSKNNEEDVLETFRAHPEMPLGLQHFVARRLNWEPKPESLIALAAELELGLDSFIVVDDNPKECAEIEANCPEVLTLPLPQEPQRIADFLAHVWPLDHLRTTREDERRSDLYAQQIERNRLEKQSASLEDFLTALQVEVRIEPMLPDQLPRVAQLTQRTNQMNFTCVRRSESEVQTVLGEGGSTSLTVHVSDRFGQYGLTGVVIFRSGAGALEVDTFLLSCRVLGRGVEHRVLARLGEIAKEHGLDRVDVPFVRSARNRPALDFLESVGSQFQVATDSGFVFRLPAANAAEVRYRPSARPRVTARVDASNVNRAAAPKTVDYVRIASELSKPEAILARIRAGKPGQELAAAPVGVPRTELERQLVAMWSELLHVPAVGIHDNFFDLGGHSLLAVQLLSRVRERFQVDLSLQVVYGGAFTVAELAKAIELKEIEEAGADEYAALLQELESLSDDEVKTLLAEEDHPAGNKSR